MVWNIHDISFLILMVSEECFVDSFGAYLLWREIFQDLILVLFIIFICFDVGY